jgi:iron complex outermembrane receptor protein
MNTATPIEHGARPGASFKPAPRRSFLRIGIAALALSLASLMAEQPEPVVSLDKFIVEENRNDPMNVVPQDPIDSPFGFARTVLETPRSTSVISAEMIERYNIQTINDLVAVAPGTFTSSFFGIAGQIDLRGSPGETFFRGMKRIENPGNYPTPIGASDRIDIVRGPPSPIFGPGKVGGYLNFEPKSARARTGRYLEKPTGAITANFGSWDKRIVSAEVGGPGEILGKRAGYYGYLMMEKSDSYYENGFQDQFIVQTTFDIDLTPSLRIEFGEQYHYWGGTENGGWNRVTQQLIDDGTYLSGTAAIRPDTDGDGAISPAEAAAVGGLSRFWPFGTPPPVLGAQYALDPATVRTVKLGGDKVLVDSIDDGESDSVALFFDVILDATPDLTVRSKLFVDYLDRFKHASYGFSQDMQVFSIEEKIVVEHRFAPTDWLQVENAYTVSFRAYDAQTRADSFFELANRRDLYLGATPNDRVVLSFFRPDLNPWGSNTQSKYTDLGAGVLSELKFSTYATLLLGARFDSLDFDTTTAPGIRTTPGQSASAKEDAKGYSASLTFNVKPTIKPYVTVARQPTPILGQAGEVALGSVRTTPLYNSELTEAGLKFELFEKKLFAAFAAYKQNRSSFDTLTNTVSSTKGEGFESELRYAPTRNFNLTGVATFQSTKYYPLTLPHFSYTTPLITGNDAASAYAGVLQTSFPGTAFYEERPGIADRVFSVYGTYFFDSGIGVTVGSIYTSDVPSGQSRLIHLPDSLVWNGSISYATANWNFKFSINNITNERYFRANLPDVFGDFSVLPQLPRHYQFTVGYKF